MINQSYLKLRSSVLVGFLGLSSTVCMAYVCPESSEVQQTLVSQINQGLQLGVITTDFGILQANIGGMSPSLFDDLQYDNSQVLTEASGSQGSPLVSCGYRFSNGELFALNSYPQGSIHYYQAVSSDWQSEPNSPYLYCHTSAGSCQFEDKSLSK